MSIEAFKHFDRKDGKHNDELREVDSGENHFQNIFDEDEDRAGERVDLATGKPIDNSTYTAVEGATIRIVSDSEAMREKPEDVGIDTNDDAAKWLAENS